MLWRFTLIDRNNTGTVVEEPNGWDAIEIEVSRDKNTHGVFFDFQSNSFQFYGEAAQLLKDEHDLYGVDGDITLLIEQNCAGSYEELYRGKLLFTKYEYDCGDECFVTISMETTSDVMLLRNKWDQQVDLETTKGFDEVTDLPAYDGLPMELLLPSKGVFIQDDFRQDKDFTTSVRGVPINDASGSGPTTYNSEFGMIQIGFDNNVSAEIGNAGTEAQSTYGCTFTSVGDCGSINRFTLAGSSGGDTAIVAPLDISPYVNYAEGTLNYGAVDGVCDLNINIQGSLTTSDPLCGIQGLWWVLTVLPATNPGNHDSDYIYHAKTLLSSGGVGPITLSLNVSHHDPNFVLNKGDRIYCFYAMYHRRRNDSIAAGTPAFTMSFNQGNYFKLTNISHTPATISKVFMVNEALSRITEAITNDRIKVFSEYFGRTDSQPYSHAEDGCGSLESVTKGLLIRRQENMIPDKPFKINLSLKDMFAGLEPIHHVGFGVEDDTNRFGHKRLRIEHWKYFYKEDILMSCTLINNVKRKTIENEHYSTFQFGYDKWEAEQYNGLDEFLTKRKYRTTLNSVKNELTKISQFVASGYALEITRRKGNEDSKDWRYDNDTFIICLTREIKLHTVFDETNNTIKIFLNGNTYPTIPATFVISGTTSNNGTFTRSGVNDDVEPDGDTFILTFGLVETVVDEENYTTEIVNFLFYPRISVEQGNVINPVNIIDPATIYNYRISPIRNAMRWMDEILAIYKQINGNAKILFTDGDGNYYAEGEMASDLCKLEGGAIAENARINTDTFATPAEIMPILQPERISFKYPMSVKDFKAILANPYGKIHFESGCESGDAWIESIKYRPEQGDADFTLIPELIPIIACIPVAIAGTPDLPNAVEGLPYSYSFSLTGDNPFVLSNIIKPSWMSIAVSGINVIFSGIPDNTDTDIPVSFDFSNCDDANTVSFEGTFDVVAAPEGDIIMACNVSTQDPITFGVASTGIKFYGMGIIVITPGTVVITAHNDQVGSLSGYSIYGQQTITVIPGQTNIIFSVDYDGGGTHTIFEMFFSVTDLSGTRLCDGQFFSFE